MFARSKLEILAKWRRHRDLKKFVDYFNEQWLVGHFVNWKIFNTPPGNASTNGPIESYNNKIKRFFTNRVKYNMLPALKILISQLNFESERDLDFLMKFCHLLSSSMMQNSLQFKFELNRKVHFTIELGEECKCPDCCFCSCSIFIDKGYCVHLLMACLFAKISFPGVT